MSPPHPPSRPYPGMMINLLDWLIVICNKCGRLIDKLWLSSLTTDSCISISLSWLDQLMINNSLSIMTPDCTVDLTSCSRWRLQVDLRPPVPGGVWSAQLLSASGPVQGEERRVRSPADLRLVVECFYAISLFFHSIHYCTHFPH